MSDDYLRGLRDALEAANEVGPTGYAYSVTAILRSLVAMEERKLRKTPSTPTDHGGTTCPPAP